MKVDRYCILLIIILLGSATAHAQEKRSEVTVDFRVNSTEIESDFSNNASKISDLVSFLQRIQTDSTLHLTNISFCGATSLEGSYEWNNMLARGRMAVIERLVRSKLEIPDSIVTHFDNYIPWEYFAKLVKESDISHKDEILRIINQEPEIVHFYTGRTIDMRVLRLRALEHGRVWRELDRRFFAPMRNASVVFVTFREALLPIIAPFGTDSVFIIDSSPLMSSVLDSAYANRSADTGNRWFNKLYVKTNALGWGLGISNAAVEIDLGRHWSFNLPVYYSAWNYFSPTVKFRTFAIQPEIRYWFSNKNLYNDGLFAGAHFSLAYYNIATNGEYRTQDHDGKAPALGGGLAVGYRMPISKDNRWKIEFSLGVGAYSLHYDLFLNTPNGPYVSTEKKTYIGIDQASVSISYTFDIKGGAR